MPPSCPRTAARASPWSISARNPPNSWSSTATPCTSPPPSASAAITSPAIFGGGQFHQDILGVALGERAAEFHFDQFGVLEAEAQALGEIAGEVIAADADGGGEVHGVAVEDHEFGGFRTDIDQGLCLSAVLGQDSGIAGGQRFVDRLLTREVGGVDGADDGVVLLNGGGHQMDVDFQARGQHLAWK